MEHEEQLSWERRVGRTVAGAAFASAILLLAALVYGSSISKPPPDGVSADTVYSLGFAVHHKGQFFLVAALQSLSVVLLAPPLWFLYKVTSFRRPETPWFAKWMALIGPPLLGVFLMVGQIVRLDRGETALRKLHQAPLTPKAANDFLDKDVAHGAAVVVQVILLPLLLITAFALVLVSLNAMRAGVLSRFMGVVGIIVGVLLVVPIFGQVPFVQVFWVAALGLLFLGRWPQGGRGPAWDSGEPIPWPTAADRQAKIAEARADREASREEERERTAVAVADPADDGANGDQPARRSQPSAHPRSKKRKRKRR